MDKKLAKGQVITKSIVRPTGRKKLGKKNTDHHVQETLPVVSPKTRTAKANLDHATKEIKMMNQQKLTYKYERPQDANMITQPTIQPPSPMISPVRTPMSVTPTPRSPTEQTQEYVEPIQVEEQN